MNSIHDKGDIQFINIKTTNTRAINISDACVLIDEIHTFDTGDLLKLKSLLCGEPREFYISMLPSSFSNNILPNTKYMISRANLVISITAECNLCGSKTSMSGETKKDKKSEREVIVGKNLFEALCSSCKKRIKNF